MGYVKLIMGYFYTGQIPLSCDKDYSPMHDNDNSLWWNNIQLWWKLFLDFSTEAVVQFMHVLGYSTLSIYIPTNFVNVRCFSTLQRAYFWEICSKLFERYSCLQLCGQSVSNQQKRHARFQKKQGDHMQFGARIRKLVICSPFEGGGGQIQNRYVN